VRFQRYNRIEGVHFTELWEMDKPNRPAPAITFELVIDDTLKDDLGEKVRRYGQIGVSEYFAYDPHKSSFVKKERLRLQGWRYVNEQPIPIPPNEKDWLWSEELKVWLVPDPPYLQFYSDGERRLTKAEYFEKEARSERKARLDAEQRAGGSVSKIRRIEQAGKRLSSNI